MENNKIMPINPPENRDGTLPEAINSMMGMMAAMAEMTQSMARRLNEMEQEIHRLTKVTPAQARAINAAIREHAENLCRQYRAEGYVRETSNAIRKELRVSCGISSVRDLPRCDYQLALETIDMWDDYKLMRKLAKKKMM